MNTYSLSKKLIDTPLSIYVKLSILIGSLLSPVFAVASSGGTVADKIKSNAGYGGIQAQSGGSGEKVISAAGTGVNMVLAVAVFLGMGCLVLGLVHWRTLSRQNQPVTPALISIGIGVALISAGALGFGFSAELTSFFFKTS